MRPAPRSLAVSLTVGVTLAGPAGGQWVEEGCAPILEIVDTVQDDLFGWNVVALGDVTGDGVPDLAAAATFGGNSQGIVSARDGATGDEIWSRMDPLVSAILGYALETMDWNGDGLLDVVAAAPFAAGGRVYVYDGATGETLEMLTNTGNGFGASVAVGGDVDGDGADDLVISAPFHDGVFENAGRVYVYASDGSVIGCVDGPAVDAELGIGAAFVGDISTPPDGRDEIVVGRRLADFFEGQAIVYSWNGTALEPVYTVGGVGMGYNLIGDRIDGGRDLDGDGVGDFMVGDMFASEARVFSGADGAPLYTLTGEGQGGSFGTGHLVHDVSGDGRADVLIGSWGNDTGAENGGRLFIYSGASGSLILTMTPTSTWYRFGLDARLIDDMNGDGAADIIVGAPGGGFNGPPPGRVFVMPGPVVDDPGVPGDVNGDGAVDTTDLVLLIVSWGDCIDCDNCADINGDCTVGVLDLVILITNWT